MDRQKFIELTKSLKKALIVRDNNDHYQLFCRDAVKHLDDCISKLRYAERMGYDDTYFCGVINFELKKILETVAQLQKTGGACAGVNDVPDSLRAVREILTEISRIGLAGHFKDPTYALPVLVTSIATYLQQKERLLEEIHNLPLPV